MGELVLDYNLNTFEGKRGGRPLNKDFGDRIKMLCVCVVFKKKKKKKKKLGFCFKVEKKEKKKKNIFFLW